MTFNRGMRRTPGGSYNDMNDIRNSEIIEEENDQLLKDAGWNSKTPDIFNFWERYRYSFNTDNLFETYDGTAILTSEWTLDNHFDYFG